MIRTVVMLDPPVPRLLAAIHSHSPEAAETPTLVVGAGCAPHQLDELLAEAPEARLLMVSALGVHPDARAPRLRALWDLEERSRGAGRAVLTLRLAPIVGPSSPLWLRLRSRPALPWTDRLLNPVVESDAVETLARALGGEAVWEGWYEVAGPETLTLGELATLAAGAPRLPGGAGAWEPSLDEMREHRLAEIEPWSGHFGVTPRRVSEEATQWR